MMKIRLTFDISEKDRIAIKAYYGESQPASRKEVERMIRDAVDASLNDFRNAFDHKEAE